MKVLFVCRGNVGRSQVAQMLFNSIARGRHSAFSAGTEVKELEGEKLKDKESAGHILAVLAEVGIDASENIRTHLTEEMVDTADVVVSMAERETWPGFLEASSKTVYWEVVDPFNESLDFTRGTRDKINALVIELLKTVP